MKRLWPTHARYGLSEGLLTIVTPPTRNLHSGVIFLGVRNWLPHFVIGAFDINALPQEPPFQIKARTLGFGCGDTDRRFHRISRVEFTVA